MTKRAFRSLKTTVRATECERTENARSFLVLAVWLVWLAGFLVCSLMANPHNPAGPLDLPLVRAATSQAIPLRTALEELGSSVSGGYVLFGLEEQLSDGKEPVVNLNINGDSRLGTALRDVLAQLPTYEMEVISDHLINLRPKGDKRNPDNILNLRVASFDAVSKPAYAILDAPQEAIPELHAALRPKPEPGRQLIEIYSGGHHGGPPVTLHLKDVTVREILNATSVATEAHYGDHILGQYPRGWVYSFNPSPSPGSSKYSWRSLFSMPPEWGLREKQKSGPSHQ
jgi:hypothetical protein